MERLARIRDSYGDQCGSGGAPGPVEEDCDRGDHRGRGGRRNCRSSRPQVRLQFQCGGGHLRPAGLDQLRYAHNRTAALRFRSGPMLLRSLFHSGILSISRVTARLCVLAIVGACGVSAAPALKVTSAALPNGTVGTAYSQTLSASGGSGTYSWSVTNGSLPAGLSLSTGGAITGTPTAAGPANFTVQVKDGSQNTATKDLEHRGDSGPAARRDGLIAERHGRRAAYSETLGARAGQAGIPWSLTTGPSGPDLPLSGGGTISGHPWQRDRLSSRFRLEIARRTP